MTAMSTALDTLSAFHRGTAPVFALLSAEQKDKLLQLQGDPSIADRVEELADKANEGELTAEERAEYEGYIRANNVLAILRAEARFHSASHPR